MTEGEETAVTVLRFLGQILGITQVDAVTCEDGGQMLYGYTDDENRAFIASPPELNWRKA